MIKLRLKRYGRKQRPCYRIVAMDSRVKRDGKAIEELGFYCKSHNVKNHRKSRNPFTFLFASQITFRNFPTSIKAFTVRSMSSVVCAAEIWTRMRAFPLGTTG